MDGYTNQQIADAGLHVRDGNAGQQGPVMTDAVRILRKRLARPARLICREPAERGIETPYLVIAAMPGGEIVLGSNIGPAALRPFGEELMDVAGRMAAPPDGIDARSPRSVVTVQ